jgi:hypothetical protein
VCAVSASVGSMLEPLSRCPWALLPQDGHDIKPSERIAAQQVLGTLQQQLHDELRAEGVDPLTAAEVEDDSLMFDENGEVKETGYMDEKGEMRRPWCAATRILEHREMVSALAPGHAGYCRHGGRVGGVVAELGCMCMICTGVLTCGASREGEVMCHNRRILPLVAGHRVAAPSFSPTWLGGSSNMHLYLQCGYRWRAVASAWHAPGLHGTQDACHCVRTIVRASAVPLHRRHSVDPTALADPHRRR